jgi:hypothetical protein
MVGGELGGRLRRWVGRGRGDGHGQIGDVDLVPVHVPRAVGPRERQTA